MYRKGRSRERTLVDHELLKRIRKERYRTQAEAAKALGEELYTYRSWEQGKRQPPPEKLTMLADHFNTQTDLLLGRTQAPPNPVSDDAADRLHELTDLELYSVLRYIDFLIDSRHRGSGDSTEHTFDR